MFNVVFSLNGLFACDLGAHIFLATPTLKENNTRNRIFIMTTTFAMWLPPRRARYVWEYIIAQNSFTTPTHPCDILRDSSNTQLRVFLMKHSCEFGEIEMCAEGKNSICVKCTIICPLLYSRVHWRVSPNSFVRSCADSCNLYSAPTTIPCTIVYVGCGVRAAISRMDFSLLKLIEEGAESVARPFRKENFALLANRGGGCMKHNLHGYCTFDTFRKYLIGQ